MKRVVDLTTLLFSLLVISTGFVVYAVDYDYSFTAECLSSPLKPQYDGGIVVNPELNDGLSGWSMLGDSKIDTKVSKDGNNYIIASDRKGPYHGFSQKFHLEKDTLYVVSGWLQVSQGEADIAVTFKTQGSFETAAWAIARSGCWSMFKGGLTVDSSGPAELYFETNNTSIDVLADSISVKPFSQEEWKSHQQKSIEKVRKSKVAIQVVDSQGKPLPNATISLIRGRPNFPLGVAINRNILNNVGYQNWFFSRFKYTVFENEMKWPSTEPTQGHEDYSAPDAMLKLVKGRGVNVRGQNVLWDDPKFQSSWVLSLPPNQLSAAAGKRVASIVRRYNGQLIHWDVVNENMHNSFFESKLGATASSTFYRLAEQFDNKQIPFLNEYNTIEDNSDPATTPPKYLAKINQMRTGGYRGPLGIGVQGHWKKPPNQPFIRSALDTLASSRLPIWITELDVIGGPSQAQFLDQILNELAAHPAVGGIIIWSAWSPGGCFRMCLTDNNFRNLPTGNVVDKNLKALVTQDLEGITDSNGYFEASLFHGDYQVKVNHPSMLDLSLVHNVTVTSSAETHQNVQTYKLVTAA